MAEQVPFVLQELCLGLMVARPASVICGLFLLGNLSLQLGVDWGVVYKAVLPASL